MRQAEQRHDWTHHRHRIFSPRILDGGLMMTRPEVGIHGAFPRRRVGGQRVQATVQTAVWPAAISARLEGQEEMEARELPLDWKRKKFQLD